MGNFFGSQAGLIDLWDDIYYCTRKHFGQVPGISGFGIFHTKENEQTTQLLQTVHVKLENPVPCLIIFIPTLMRGNFMEGRSFLVRFKRFSPRTLTIPPSQNSPCNPGDLALKLTLIESPRHIYERYTEKKREIFFWDLRRSPGYRFQFDMKSMKKDFCRVTKKPMRHIKVEDIKLFEAHFQSYWMT